MEQDRAVQSLPHTRILSDDKVETIVRGALQILEEVGVKVEAPEALAVLKGRGALVKDNLARIPGDLVRACVESAPKRLIIHGRDGAPPLRLGEGNTYYAPTMTAPNVLDPFTSERRPFRRKDAALVGLLSDALPNIDYVIGGGIIDDVTPILAAEYEFAELAASTSKPLFGWAHNQVVLEDIYQMACALAGGEQEFHERPNCLIFINPTSPLVIGRDVAERVIVAAKYRIPIIIWPLTLAGGTAPATTAGSIVVALAETLAGLTLHQSVRSGAPFIFGPTSGRLDMKRGLPIGGPAGLKGDLAFADIARHLGLMSYLCSVGTSSKSVDEQAALQMACALTSVSMARPDLTAGLGDLEMGMVVSPAMLVLCDDIAGIGRRINRGLEVSDEALAIEVTRRVGPGGHFLMEDHTLAHFREEQWEPTLMDLGTYDEWDGRTMGERVRERIEHILPTHKPVPLSNDVQSAIDHILQQAEAREAGSGK